MSGLKYGNKYNYRVFAENAAGVSEPSNIIGPLLADDPHGEKFIHVFCSSHVKKWILKKENDASNMKCLKMD